MDRTLRHPLTIGLFLAATLVLFAALPASGDMTKTTMQGGLGTFLVDGKGMTLYYFTKDTPGVSVCTGGCLERWPAYDAGKDAPAPGLDPKDFGVITRPDGTSQTTFRGYPLYYFIKDAAPGDAMGQGVAKVWYVVDPAHFPPM